MLGEAETLVPKFIEENSMGAVVCDFSPLRVAASWVDKLKGKLPKDVPLCQVQIIIISAHFICTCSDVEGIMKVWPVWVLIVICLNHLKCSQTFTYFYHEYLIWIIKSCTLNFHLAYLYWWVGIEIFPDSDSQIKKVKVKFFCDRSMPTTSYPAGWHQISSSMEQGQSGIK